MKYGQQGLYTVLGQQRRDAGTQKSFVQRVLWKGSFGGIWNFDSDICVHRAISFGCVCVGAESGKVCLSGWWVTKGWRELWVPARQIETLCFLKAFTEGLVELTCQCQDLRLFCPPVCLDLASAIHILFQNSYHQQAAVTRLGFWLPENGISTLPVTTQTTQFSTEKKGDRVTTEKKALAFWRSINSKSQHPVLV